MSVLDLIFTANRNLTRAKLRTLLTILAIFVGGFTLTLTTALNTGANDYLNRQLGNVSKPGVFEVTPKTETNPFSTDIQEYDPDTKTTSLAMSFLSTMDQSDVDKLKAVAEVENVEPYYTLSPEYIARGGGGKKYGMSVLSQDFGLKLDLAAGRLLSSGDTNSVILPENFVEPLGFKDPADAVNKKVTLAYKNMEGTLVEKELTVLGVSRGTVFTASQVFTDQTTATAIAKDQAQDKKFSRTFVTFAESVVTRVGEPELKSRIENAGNFTALSLEEQISGTLSVVSAITAGLNVVGIIALLAASFGIINTLLMSVYERTQEIGLMKALGMRRAKVFGLFAIEAVLVGFWGSVVAVVAALGASALVNSYASQTFLKDFDGFTLLAVTPGGALFVVLLIMAIAFAAGTLPAVKASRLNPIEALRSE